MAAPRKPKSTTETLRHGDTEKSKQNLGKVKQQNRRKAENTEAVGFVALLLPKIWDARI